MYFLAVLRSTLRLSAISLVLRPARQWTMISTMSATSKVLLAMGSDPMPVGRECSSCAMTNTRLKRELRDRNGELIDRQRVKLVIHDDGLLRSFNVLRRGIKHAVMSRRRRACFPLNRKNAVGHALLNGRREVASMAKKTRKLARQTCCD
jgi:hypothetical protein